MLSPDYIDPTWGVPLGLLLTALYLYLARKDRTRS